MGFSVRVAKGVRISASSRGIRTSVRSGPVSYSFGTGGRRSGSGSGSAYATTQRAIREAAKQEEAQGLRQAFERILNLHRQEFSPAEPPVAPPQSPLDEAAIVKRNESEALAGIGLFKRSERAAARERAAQLTQHQIATDLARRADEHIRAQAELDDFWNRLCANEPEATLGALADAFEDNEAAAAPVNVEGAEATLVMLAPGTDVVPEKYPTYTDAGNLTLRKLPKTDRTSLYKGLVCGHLLATIRETFAVAPGLRSARVVVLRAASPDAYGRVAAELLLAGRWQRSAFEGVRWADADAVLIVDDTASELVTNQRGTAKELTAVALSREPALAELIAQVDFAELSDA